MSENTKYLLAVTENDAIQEVAKALLSERGWKVITATTSSELRLKFDNQNFDLILGDLELVSVGLRDFIESVRKKEGMKGSKSHHIPIILVGMDAKKFHKDFFYFESCTFIQTPFTGIELGEKIKSLFGKSSQAQGTKSFAQGEYLIKEGEQSNAMYYVTKGKFIITKENREGKSIIIGEASAGELIGEMSFLDDLPRSASVKASEDSEVMAIPHSKFVETLEKQPKWFKGLMKTLSQRIRNANEIIARKFAQVDIDEVEQIKENDKISGV